MLDDKASWRDAARQRARGAVLYFPTFAPRLSRPGIQRISGAFMARIEVKSEITGTVWQVKASVGDKVEEGDTLVVIESMKMEIPVITEDAGVVKEIMVKEKDPVAEGQVVAILED
jgi:acetyl-CoA carboxylase biotin carboxyl carrier protein